MYLVGYFRENFSTFLNLTRLRRELSTLERADGVLG